MAAGGWGRRRGGCRKGARVRVRAALCHVAIAATSGLGLFFRVGGTAPRAKPGSASAAWRLLAARGRRMSRLPVQVSHPALQRLVAAGKGGQPALTPWSLGEGDPRESGRGAGSAVSSKWGAEARAGDSGRRSAVPRGPLLCVRSIGVTWKGVRGWRWERGPGRGQGKQVTAVQVLVQVLDPGAAKVVSSYFGP